MAKGLRIPKLYMDPYVLLNNKIYLATRALTRSGTDVEQKQLWHSQHSSLSQKYSVVLRSGFCADHVFIELEALSGWVSQ